MEKPSSQEHFWVRVRFNNEAQRKFILTLLPSSTSSSSASHQASRLLMKWIINSVHNTSKDSTANSHTDTPFGNNKNTKLWRQTADKKTHKKGANTTVKTTCTFLCMYRLHSASESKPLLPSPFMHNNILKKINKTLIIKHRTKPNDDDSSSSLCKKISDCSSTEIFGDKSGESCVCF